MIVIADHAQTQVTEPLPLADELGSRMARAAAEPDRPARGGARRLPELAGGRRLRAVRRPAPAWSTPASATGCASSTASTCSPGSSTTPPRCAAATPTARRRAAAPRWSSATARSCASGRARRSPTVAASAGTSTATRRRSRRPSTGTSCECDQYPDGLARLWAALTAPHAGEILISAEPGYELRGLGRRHPLPGRQPRRPARRRLARPAAAVRVRAGHRAAARPMGDPRRRRPGAAATSASAATRTPRAQRTAHAASEVAG